MRLFDEGPLTIDTTLDLSTLLTREPLYRSDGVLDYLGHGCTYSATFGDQWNRFREVQIDSLSGSTESRDRFFAETGWNEKDLRGKLLLDVGCGAGRFTEIALSCGARVVALDMSTAAWACRRTISRFQETNYLVLRADLFDLPLKRQAFDGVYALGVLQHTPDPLQAVQTIARYVAPGGRLATWIYERRTSVVRWLQPRNWIRPAVATRLEPTAKLRLARALTMLFFPFGWGLSWGGRTGLRLSALLPYAARHERGRGNLRRQYEYSVMDTYDWYGPVYDQPQSESDVIQAMQIAGLRRVRRLPARGMAIVGEAL